MDVQPEPDDEIDPAIGAIVDAMLAGTAVDWAAAESPSSPDAELVRQLHVLADLATLHRTFASGETPPTGDTPSPRIWGHLKLLEKVGEGAFGEVFRAWDPHLNREVALKLFAPNASPEGADSRAWVLTEARHLAAIHHPNVVVVYGADRIDGRLGFWTEFIRGRTLAALVRDLGPLGAHEAAAIGRDVCFALSAVHGASLLHRDIKANNVMLEDGGRNTASGRVVLLDFGATKNFIDEAAADAAIDHPEGPTGTPLYVAPELWRASPASPQSDIYSVGVLLYFLVTGSYPVRGATVRDVGEAHLSGRRMPLRDARPDLPDAFVRVVERAIAPDTAERFASVDELASALDRTRVDLARSSRAARARWNGRLMLASAAAIAVLVGYAIFRVWPPHAEVPIGSASSRSTVPTSSATSTPTLPVRSAGSTPAASSGPPGGGIAQSHDSETRQVTVPPAIFGHPSRDGRFLPYFDPDGTGRLFDIETGASRPFTKDGTPSDRGVDWTIEKDGRWNLDTPSLAVISPAGDRVAYTWYRGDGRYELDMSNVDGSLPRTLLVARPEFEPVPVDWFPDANEILCWFRGVDGTTADLVAVSVADGWHRSVYSKAGDVPLTALSPDGRFVVFEQTPDGGQPGLMIVSSAGGGNARPLFKSPAGEQSPAWADQTHLLFRRPAAPGKKEMWLAQVIEGAIVGAPVNIFPTTNLASSQLMAVPSRGLVYYTTQKLDNEAFIASIDLSGATRASPPVLIADQCVSPSWSPDGRSIACFLTRASGVPGGLRSGSLAILDATSHVPRALHPALTFQGKYMPAWLPDSQHVVIFGSETSTGPPRPGDRFGYYRVDVTTSETSPFAMVSDYGPVFRVLPSGRGILYSDARGIVARDSETHAETIALADEAGSDLGGFGVSADGRLAFIRSPLNQHGEETMDVLQVQAISGGPVREIARAIRPQGLKFQSWTPDGEGVLYSLSRPGAAMAELYLISSDGTGEPKDLHIRLPSAGGSDTLSLNPDGTQVVYGSRQQSNDLWIQPIPRALLAGGR